VNRQFPRLLSVSRDGDWTGWCIFFLKAMEAQAKENHRKAEAILNLYDAKKQELVNLPGSKHAMKALDFLFERPIFKSTAFTQEAGIPVSSGKRILNALQKKGIVRALKPQKGSSPAVFAFSDLLNVAEGNDAL